MGDLDPRVSRMKDRLLTTPYEICLARALAFTRSYRKTEGMNANTRNALALKATLESQRIWIDPDERIVGSKTEKPLAGPLSVERGDFLRALQFEMEVLHLKRRPFSISSEEKRLFYDEILPFWDGRTVRDRKAAEWEERGLIDPPPRAARKRSACHARVVSTSAVHGPSALPGARTFFDGSVPADWLIHDNPMSPGFARIRSCMRARAARE